MTSYNAVPPPTLEEGKDEEEEERGGVSPESKREAVKEWESRQEKPAHVSADHWKRFQQLKARRERQNVRSTHYRKEAVKKSALRAGREACSLQSVVEEECKFLANFLPKEFEVGRAVTVEDIEDVLKEEGVDISLSLPRKQQHREAPSSPTLQVWQEVRDHLDPNPQLKGLAEHQKQAPKSGLEERLDQAVEEGRFESASQFSDQLAQRELARRVSTAIDSYKYSKRKQQEKDRRASKKSKLLWRFERKERWETKGNM